jgi:hypothetical protein
VTRTRRDVKDLVAFSPPIVVGCECGAVLVMVLHTSADGTRLEMRFPDEPGG